jgi:hypothetical protein
MIGLEQIKLFGWDAAGEINPVGIFTWNSGTLAWEKQAPISGGGGGGAATIADGADVAEGATTDAAVITDTAGTVSGKLRGLVKWAFERMPASLGQKVMAASLPVVIASDQSAVAISAASLPLPTGAATEATLATRVADATITARLNTLGQKAMAASAPVVIASDQSAIPLSAGTARVGAVYPVSGQVIDENGTVRIVNRAAINFDGATADVELIAAQGAGVKIRLLSLNLMVGTGANLRFKSGTTVITGKYPVLDAGGIVMPDNQHGWIQTAANEALNLNVDTPSVASVGGMLTWIQAT